MNHEEDNEQAAFLQAFQLQWPKLFPFLFAIPNGGRREIKEAMRLKKAGVKRGIPDLFLAYPMMRFHGMFIEMKSKKGQLSPEQKEYHRIFKDHDFHVVTCRSSLDALYESKRYLSGWVESPQPKPCYDAEKVVLTFNDRE